MNNYSDGAFRPVLDRAGAGAGAGGPAPRTAPAGRALPRSDAKVRLIAQVARLYHEGRLTQNQIATQLRFSQGNVCRLLQKAEEDGIVRVTVVPPEGTFVDLEELLERRFGLAQVIVARANAEADGPVQSALGTAAAHFLETTLRPREVIGVASGSASLQAMVEGMHPVWKLAECQVVQILGGLGDSRDGEGGDRLVAQLAGLVQGEARFLPAPSVLASEEAADVLAQDPHLRETMALFAGITVALVGIGSVGPASCPAGEREPFSDEDYRGLKAAGAVGNLCLRYYDVRGKEVKAPEGARVFGLEAARLKSIPRVVGIGGGRQKRDAILGAVRGRWINVLITDQFTAETLART